jgi:serine/threonine-protein kinase RsbW
VRSAYPFRLRLTIASTKRALNEAVDELLVVAEHSGCLEESRADVEIAAREALANAVLHGNSSGSDKSVFLRCYAAPRSGVLILVRDQGNGFDPDTVPDPRDKDRMHLHHGRGLFLMRALMDYVEYRRGGCEVLMYKAYRGPDAG